MTPARRELPRRFFRIAAAGTFFQGGLATVDPSTIIAALVMGLTGSTTAVGAAAAISRFGWLFPQLFVAFVAQRRTHRLPLYMTGAFGRVACLAAIGALMWLGGSSPSMIVVVLFFVLWAVYALVSGIVAVPYNDIVARSIPSTHRSRLLATRFFVGGILALGVAAVVHRLLTAAPSQGGFGAVLVLGAALFMISALFFVSAGEPKAPLPAQALTGFVPFLRGGLIVFARDSRFRMFLVSRWLGGAVTMTLPFYILQVNSGGDAARYVAVLLGSQTVGALLSNPLWGWWGDRKGKLSLLAVVAALGVIAPALALGWLVLGNAAASPLALFVIVFFLLGAVGNGETIAMLGFLMEISPDDQRPAYSGYFSMMVAPAALLPLVGAALAELASYTAMFAVAAVAALCQVWVVGRIGRYREGKVQ